MPKAYSYLRFSSPEQGKGDSFRRQIEMARNYAALNKLELDENLQFHDYGVSAYHSRNSKIGALKKFLINIESGIIDQGSYLLIESIDRITRDEILAALDIFLKIIKSGITLVTLVDEKIYNKESVICNPTDLLISLLVMMRAREESETKSERFKAAWVRKRSKIKDGVLYSRSIPAWLRINESKHKFEVIKDKSKIIKLIFKKASQGESYRSITRYLNLNKIPNIGDKEHWSFSQVYTIIYNWAVIGTLKLYTRERKADKIVKSPCGEIHNYYPSIIESTLFKKIHEKRKVNDSGNGGRPGGNIFYGIAKCSECGSSMVRLASGSFYKYLRCSRAMHCAGCIAHRIGYYSLEKTLIQNINYLVGSAPKCDTKEIDKELASSSIKIENLNNKITYLNNFIYTGKKSYLNRMATVENKLKEELKSQSELKRKKAILSDSYVHLKLSHLRHHLNCSPLNVSIVNSLLHLLFSTIIINYDKGQISFNWLQGGTTDIKYTQHLELNDSYYRNKK